MLKHVKCIDKINSFKKSNKQDERVRQIIITNSERQVIYLEEIQLSYVFGILNKENFNMIDHSLASDTIKENFVILINWALPFMVNWQVINSLETKH